MAEKRKRMTQKQKDYNRKIKKKLQEDGVIPPDKKRLSREKFVNEAINEWRSRKHCHIWDVYLSEAAMIITARTDVKRNISLEAVGAAKVLKMALKLREFDEKMREQCRKEYTYQEKMEYVWDIFQA